MEKECDPKGRNNARRIANTIRSATIRGKVLGERFEQLLGCSLDGFKAYIESHFHSELSWENSEIWHLDHRMPISSFDLTSEDELRKCFHYSNYMPMLATENSSKNDSIIESLVWTESGWTTEEN